MGPCGQVAFGPLQQAGPCWGSQGCALVSPALSSTPFSSPTMNHDFPCTNASTLARGAQPASPRTMAGRRRQRRREHRSSCKPGPSVGPPGGPCRATKGGGGYSWMGTGYDAEF
jgi:hypothetical protein